MHIVQVDVVDAEPLPRAVEGLADMGRAIVEEASAALAPTNGELGCERHPGAPAFVLGQELADQVFAEPIAVDIGGVPEVDAEIERRRQRSHGFGFVCRSVEATEAHGAKADGRNRSMPPNAPSHW